ALELAYRQPAGAAELGLAGFAQKPGFQHSAKLVLQQFSTAPVDVEGPDRVLAGCWRGVGALPSVIPVACLEKVGQSVSLLAVLRVRLRIGDNTQPGERPARVEQSR